MALFDNALAEMGENKFLAPKEFLTYAAHAGFSSARPAPNISVQTLSGLAPELKNAGVMVFRLGSSATGRGTSFALASYSKSWDDYFLQDQSIFQNCSNVASLLDSEDLRIFKILPKCTETSLVSFAVAAGIFKKALSFDSNTRAIVSATAQGTYTFDVRPHPDLIASWQHKAGQVEIDGAFIVEREGVETLYLVEAKVSEKFESLSKHKLAYPMLALQRSIPSEMQVVGVYLRVIRSRTHFDFYVAECRFSSLNQEIASLVPVRVSLCRYERSRLF